MDWRDDAVFNTERVHKMSPVHDPIHQIQYEAWLAGLEKAAEVLDLLWEKQNNWSDSRGAAVNDCCRAIRELIPKDTP